MKKFLYALIILVFAANLTYSQDITYGYNELGQYGPVAIDGNRITYGYNELGQYVPVAIGNLRVIYSYNDKGEYVPIALEDPMADYEALSQAYYQKIRTDYNKCKWAIGVAGLSGNNAFLHLCK